MSVHRSVHCVLVFSLLGFLASVARGQEDPPIRSNAWTRDSVMQQLQLHPRDPYLQFVLLQLSQTAGQRLETQHALPRAITERQRRMQRNQRIDLYSIFSGSLAVQESLQLDAMMGEARLDLQEKSVAVASLQGPSVQSHPWEEMLDGRSPQTSKLADCVPDDYLFVRFQSVAKLMVLQRRLDDWYVYSVGNLTGSTRSARVMNRLQRQWLVETNDLLMPVYDAAVSEVAVTSSDLFFREGTDATLILRLNQPELLRSPLDQMLEVAVKTNADAKLQQGSILGVPFKHVTTPDRSIHVYVANPTGDLHVRSNSKFAFERVLRTILGKPKGDRRIRPLSQTDEFRYIRTLMPLGADEEDGLIYLSDPFIRNLIGPEKKLTQRNRLVCRGRLQLLRHAQLLFRTQHGRDPASIDEMRRFGCLGSQDRPQELICPNGGSYSIDSGAIGCRCSHHGLPDAMVPCCELPVASVTPSQAEEYRQFVTQYSRYWRTFFDPIAVRIQLEPKKTRIETIVLPLINNSIYQGLVASLGGKPESLDSLPVAESSICSLAFKLDKERWLKRSGIPAPAEHDAEADTAEVEAAEKSRGETMQIEQALVQVGLGLHNFHSAFKQLPPRTSASKSDLSAGLSWRVHLLPFIEEQELYSQFKLDEPWDSEHNRQLISRIPDVFAVGSGRLALEGETRIVFPLHPDAIYHDVKQGAKYRDVLDGLSNTIQAVVADENHAVIWTRPDDLAIDMSTPRQGWSDDAEEFTSVLLAEGRVARIPSDLSDEIVGHLMTRRGGEVIKVALTRSPVTYRRRSSSRRPPWLNPERFVDELALDQFLYRGVGSQIGVHICDDDPLVDFNVSRFAGMLSSNFTGRSGGFSMNTAMFGLLAVAFNSPVYVAVPVQDAAVVDQTLEKLDQFLARLSRMPSDQFGSFLQIEQDFYRSNQPADASVRAYAFRFGPITWRFYFARVGDGLYVASKPHLISQLQSAAEQAKASPASNNGEHVAHGLVHVRPQHWRKIQPHFRIGWAEAERRVCLDQLSSLSHAARSLAGDTTSRGSSSAMNQVRQMAGQVFAGRFACPNGGSYRCNDDVTSVTCSVHGTAREPMQPVPDGSGAIAAFAESLDDVALELTFLEDGLHAVVTVEAK